MKDETPIKMIALDLDGTTLAPGGILTKRNREALERALSQGIQLVVATGRCFAALPPVLHEVEGLRYLLTSNGAKIQDLHTGASIYSNCMGREAMGRIVEVLRNSREYDFGVEVFVEGRAYIDRPSYERILAGVDVKRTVDYVRDTREPLEDIYAFALAHGDQVENVNIVFEDLDMRAAMRERLAHIPGTNFTSSFPVNWELGGESTSKGEALSFLMARHGIRKEELLACGDSPNDLAMLRLAGYPVAVGNATEEVKEAACYISASNGEDGVAKALEHFLWS